MKDAKNFRRGRGGVVFMLEEDIFSNDMIEYACKAIGCESRVSRKKGGYEVFIKAESGDVKELCVGFNDALIAGVRLAL